MEDEQVNNNDLSTQDVQSEPEILQLHVSDQFQVGESFGP